MFISLFSCQPNSIKTQCDPQWYTAHLTNYTSYPEKGSKECIDYNGCKWAGYFAGLEKKQPESWVKKNNIVAVHSKDWGKLQGKSLMLHQGESDIKVVVYDLCSDEDCDGCCTANLGNDGYLIDIEKYTMERFGSGSGIVDWREVCD